MTHPGPYTIAYTPAARRQMNRLPLAAAIAMHEHLTGSVADNPYRLGKHWTPHWISYAAPDAASTGHFNSINDAEVIVTVVTVAHRRDTYRASSS